MKKNILKLISLSILTIASFGFISCGDDDKSIGSSAVSGLYYWEDSFSRSAYNFVNGNTVEIYGSMSRDPNEKWLGNSGQAFPLRSGWYYWSGNKYIRSYVVIGDKVIIGDDRVMTISGNTLIYDDLGVVLYKWN